MFVMIDGHSPCRQGWTSQAGGSGRGGDRIWPKSARRHTRCTSGPSKIKAKIRANDTSILRTIVADGAVAGNIVSWEQDGQRLLGYWIGREYWGRGVATRALAQFVRQEATRPLYAHVAVHNTGSVRVLEKCVFRRDREQEAKAPPPGDGIEEFIFVLDA